MTHSNLGGRLRQQRFIVSGGEGGEIRVWELRTREMASHLKEHTLKVRGGSKESLCPCRKSCLRVETLYAVAVCFVP